MVAPTGSTSSSSNLGSSSQSNSGSSSNPYSSSMESSQWGWNRPRSSPMRPVTSYMSGPRRTPFRQVFYPGLRGPPPQQQPYYNQRKPRPNWMPRLVRLPHFPSTPSDQSYSNYSQSSWSSSSTPAAPAAAKSVDETSQVTTTTSVTTTTTTTTVPSTTTTTSISESSEPVLPPRKKKRTANGTSRPWDKESAELALKTELEFKKNCGFCALVIRFPDPVLSKEIIQKFNTAIDNVHFQGPCSGRYCFVTLKDKANPDQVMEELNKTQFGNGHLIAEKKVDKADENVRPEDIDPFTLFVGNLPSNISTLQVKEKFPAALRIDVGYAQKMKNTRYAFARYLTTEAALEAYKCSVNSIIGGRSIVLRFRRNNAPVGPPGEKPPNSFLEASGEKMTVGAKLKAKKEMAKLKKALRERREGRVYQSDDDDSDDDKVSLDDDDSDSMDFNNEECDEIDDDEDDGEDFEDDDDDEEEGESSKTPQVENDDDDDDDDDVDQECGDIDDLSNEEVSNYKEDDSILNDDPAMSDTDFLTRLMKNKPN